MDDATHLVRPDLPCLSHDLLTFSAGITPLGKSPPRHAALAPPCPPPTRTRRATENVHYPLDVL
jgi:hypothetical protein